MNDERGRVLLRIARLRIEESFGLEAVLPVDEPWLREPGATFVTLTRGGALRGCIGSVHAHRPLGEDVRANALAAAFRDPRFPPLGREELPEIRIEVSLLSPPEPFEAIDETDALARLRPGVDGVILECRDRRSTFLPQVWEHLPVPRDFLRQLKEKAGLPRAFWAPEVRLWTYGVTKWEEGDR